MPKTTITIDVTHPDGVDPGELLLEYIEAGRQIDIDRCDDEDDDDDLKETAEANLEVIFGEIKVSCVE